MKSLSSFNFILSHSFFALLMLSVFSSCKESVYANKDETAEIETTITASASAINASNKSSFELYIDCPSVVKRITVSGSISAVIECQKNPFVISLDLSSVPDGVIHLTFTPNLGRAVTVTFEKDVIEPVVGGLTNDLVPIQIKNWAWTCEDSSTSCKFRYVISKSPIYVFTTEAFNTSAATTKPSGNGTYYLHVQAQDAAGNLSAVRTVSAELSNPTPPSLYIVSPGTTEVVSGSVDLQLFTNSANTQMYITNTPGCSAGGVWEAYAPIKVGWALNPAQNGGLATVYVKYRDSGFTETACVNDTVSWMKYYKMCSDTSTSDTSGILYDDGGPDGNYAHNNSCTFTINMTEQIWITIRSLNLSNSGDVLNISSQSYTGSGIPGLSNLYVSTFTGEAYRLTNHLIKNATGYFPAVAIPIQFITDNTGSDSGFEITWKAFSVTSEPQGQVATGSITIANDAASTTEAEVILNLNYGSLSEMYVTNTAGCGSGGTWEDVTPTKTWTLPSGEGEKNVYVKFRDSYMHESKCESDSIFLDLTPPIAPIIITIGHALTGDKAPPLSFIAGESDSTFNYAEVRLMNAANNSVIKDWTTLISGDQLAPVSLQTNLGYYFELRQRDKSGRLSSVVQSPIWYVRPLITIGEISQLALTEETGTVEFEVKSSAMLGSALTIPYTVFGEAISGSDHNLAPGNITIPTGQSSTRISFQIINDSSPESDERIRISLLGSSSSLYSLGNYHQIEYLIQANDGGAPPLLVSKVVAGLLHTCAIVNDGVQCWGHNLYNQLGSGNSNNSNTPLWIIPKLSGVTDLSTKFIHSCAVVSGGVKCWGINSSYQLGNGTTTATLVPVQPIASGSNATSVATGTYHSCAVVNGGVRCWGANAYGELGDGTTTPRSSPVQVIPALSGATKMAAGDLHTCVIINEGVQCWGSNDYGQIGNGTKTMQASPTTVIPAFSNVTAIAGGGYHTCAIISGGIKCWGQNLDGQLGIGHQRPALTPTEVLPAGSGATEITTGKFLTCALVTGRVMCWGHNSYGKMGSNTVERQLTPIEVLPASRGTISLSASEYYICAVVTGGTLCWGGNNYFGEYGNGAITDQLTPADVIPSGSQVSAISAGSFHTCVIINGGTQCWGANSDGSLGDGTMVWKSTPVGIIPTGSQSTLLTVGFGATCNVVGGGELKCWGRNAAGQIGDGTLSIRKAPTTILSSQNQITSLSTGQHTCVVIDGGIRCWGWNAFGQLGDGTLENKSSPVSVIPAGSQATAVSAGMNHTCAIINGGLKCWGNNSNGQLGDGTTINKETPTTVFPALSGVTSVATGERATCAIVAGIVKCWGLNNVGQLGDGSITNRLTPTNVSPAFPGATQISSFGSHACVLVNGGVKCWGRNLQGQLGIGTRVDSTSPVDVFPSGSGVTSVSASSNHTCVIINGGVKCWGASQEGLLGLPSFLGSQQWVFKYADP